MAFKLIIFDCDGVLIDSEWIASQVESEHLRELGIDLSTEEVSKRFSGVSAAAMYAELERDFGIVIPDTYEKNIRERIKQRFSTDLAPPKGLEKFLENRAHAVCVASNSPPDWVSHGLKCTGIHSYFKNAIYTGQMVERPKPAPDLFLHAADQFNVSPEDCLVVEDSTHGIEAAMAANMTAIGYIGGSHCREGHGDMLKSAGAKTIIEHFLKLPPIVHIGF